MSSKFEIKSHRNLNPKLTWNDVRHLKLHFRFSFVCQPIQSIMFALVVEVRPSRVSRYIIESEAALSHSFSDNAQSVSIYSISS